MREGFGGSGVPKVVGMALAGVPLHLVSYHCELVVVQRKSRHGGVEGFNVARAMRFRIRQLALVHQDTCQITEDTLINVTYCRKDKHVIGGYCNPCEGRPLLPLSAIRELYIL